jgi:hypothetical protein
MQRVLALQMLQVANARLSIIPVHILINAAMRGQTAVRLTSQKINHEKQRP